MSFLSENLLGILVACIVLLIFIKIRRLLNYFKTRGLPYIEPSWSDIANNFAMDVFSDLPIKLYNQCKNREDQYVGIYGIFMMPSVLILDPRLVQTILIKDFSYFQDHGFDVDFELNPLAKSLFNMKGDEWRTLRHKLVPTFTSGKLRGMVPIIEECADKLIQEMNQDPSLKKEVNLKDLFKKYSLSVIASTAFGIDPESIKDPNCEFRKILQDIVAPKPGSLIKFALSFVCPSLVRLLKLKVFSQEAEDFILNLTQQSFEMRKKSGEKRNDFIQLLLELKEKGSVELDAKDLEQEEKETIESIQHQPTSTKLELTDKLLMAQVFVFLIGGFENTAYLLAITTYLLSKNPEVQTRVREEVKKTITSHGSMDYQALKDMKLLHACIDEALRLYSPIGVLPRQSNKTYTFRDGNKIEKGTPVLLPTMALHNDPKYWTDPEQFKPDRFLNGESITPGTYFPFGDGPRLCIAQRMALIVAKLMMAKLVLNYELLPSSKTKEPIKLKVVFGADNDGGFWGNFKDLKN